MRRWKHKRKKFYSGSTLLSLTWSGTSFNFLSFFSLSLHQFFYSFSLCCWSYSDEWKFFCCAYFLTELKIKENDAFFQMNFFLSFSSTQKNENIFNCFAFDIFSGNRIWILRTVLIERKRDWGEKKPEKISPIRLCSPFQNILSRVSNVLKNGRM